MDKAEWTLHNPAATIAILLANNGDGNSDDLPKHYRFSGYDTNMAKPRGNRFRRVFQLVRLMKGAAVIARTIMLFLSVGIIFAVVSTVRAETTGAFEESTSGVGLPEEECGVIQKDEWTKCTANEKWAWSEISAGRDANFYDKLQEKLDPTEPDYCKLCSDKRRELRKDFLKTILFHEPFRSAIPHRGVHIVGASFKEDIDLERASLEWPLVLAYSCFEQIKMSHLRTPTFISFVGSKFEILDMSFVVIGGDLFMANMRVLDLTLRRAKINGDLIVTGSTLKNDLDMASVRIEGDLLMWKTQVAGSVSMKKTKIGGEFLMNRSIFKSELDMASAAVGDDVLMKKAEIDKSAKLMFLSVGSDLDARGAKLNGLDLTNARIGGDLRLGSGGENINENVQWKEYKDDNGAPHAPKLTLRNAKVGALYDTKTTWTDTLKWELEGLTYDRLVRFNMGEREKYHQQQETIWFIEWLAKDETYSPQPYQHLAQILRGTGFDDMANDILFESRARERRNFHITEFKWWRLAIPEVIYGYGYGWRSLWTLIWVMIFALLGTIFLYHKEERDNNGQRLGFWYSLDMLLPAIRLREQHYDIDLKSFAKYYFYVHKIIGYVLLFFLIAGLSGLTE